MSGESISIFVAIFWTASAVFFEYAGRVSKSTSLNLIKLTFAFIAIGTILFFMGGSPFPKWADGKVWLWMGLSGLAGFVFGDFFLFAAYRLIPARFTQLIMTISPLFAALAAYILLGETIAPKAFLGMVLTISGIAISILKKEHAETVHLALPWKGLVFSLLAAVGQGVGLVLSKMGMVEYEKCIAALSPEIAAGNPIYTPLAATEIRVIVGIICFAIIIALSKDGFRNVPMAFSTKKYALATIGGSISGPLIGVVLSMMAVFYTDAAIASTIIAIVPILIIIPDRFIYKRRVTLIEILGAFISVAGVALFFI